jgi:hypothetical protein
METKDNLASIRRLGRTLERLCLWAALAVAPLTACYFYALNDLPATWTAQAVHLAATPVLPAWTRLLCFLAAMVPGVALMVTLLRLRDLFGLYKEGRIFSLANVVCFRALSKALLWWAVASMAFTPLYGLAVTAANPPGRHILSLGIGSSELALFFVAAMAVVISRVMDEARRLDEEQALTV